MATEVQGSKNPFSATIRFADWEPTEHVLNKPPEKDTLSPPQKPEKNGSPSPSIIWWVLSPITCIFSWIGTKIWGTSTSTQMSKLTESWETADVPNKLAMLYELRNVSAGRERDADILRGRITALYSQLPEGVRQEIEGMGIKASELPIHFCSFGNHQTCVEPKQLRTFMTTVGRFADYLETYATYLYLNTLQFLRTEVSQSAPVKLFHLYLVTVTPPREGDVAELNQQQAFADCYQALQESEKQLLRDIYTKAHPSVNPRSDFVDGLISKLSPESARALIANAIEGNDVIRLIQSAQNDYRASHVGYLLDLLREFKKEAYQALLKIEIDSYLTIQRKMEVGAIDAEAERTKVAHDGDLFAARLAYYLQKRTEAREVDPQPFLHAVPLGDVARGFVSDYLREIV